MKGVGELLTVKEDKKMKSELYKDRDWLYQRIINDKMKPKDVATLLGVEEKIVREWSKKLGISSIRTKSPPLSISNPELAKEWNYDKNKDLELRLTPNSVTEGSNYYVWWKCDKGHEWEYQILARARRGHGCPYCSQKRASEEYNLATNFPKLMREWDWNKNTINPREITQGSSKKAWWICPIGHSYCSTISGRAGKNYGCPYCSNKKVLYETSLGFLYPRLADEWHSNKNQLTPFDVTPFSSKVVWWRCKKGEDHVWESTIRNRHDNGCPFCAGQRACKGNNLEENFPEVAKEWDYRKNSCSPHEVTGQTQKEYWWVCDNGHEWKESPSQRNKDKVSRPCPYCDNKRVSDNYNLSVIYPGVAKEWDYKKNKSDPSEYMPASAESVWWICEKNHSWKAKIYSRTSGGQNCPYCAGNRLTEERSLEFLHPQIASQWDHSKNEKAPNEYHAMSGEEVWWICPKGHEHSARISDKTLEKVTCPMCTGRKPSTERSFYTVGAHLLDEWDFHKNTKHPTEFTPKSNSQVWWICPKKHEYKSSIKNRMNGSGCPTCSAYRSTSYAEQFLFYYVSQIFENASNRTKIKGREIDIYIEHSNKKIAIEYDGWYWHKDKEKQDEEKAKIFANSSLKVINIRERPLKGISYGTNIFHERNETDLYETLYELIDELSKYLNIDKIREKLTINKKEDEIKIRKILSHE